MLQVLIHLAAEEACVLPIGTEESEFSTRTFAGIDPSRMPFAVVFLFPDGHAFLDLVDDEATGVESRFPVSGRDRDPDRQITQGQRPDAVYAYDRQNGKMLTGFGQYPVSFLLGQKRK